jgi:phosphatidylinositol alpha-mannosyltransferase
LPLSCLLYSRSVNVGTFHAARQSNIWYLYTKAALDMFFDRLDARIAVSEAAREFADNHFPADYDIIPNGIDLELYRPDVRPIPELLDGRKNILFVGRFDESRKGFTYLLRAMPAVRSQYPDARLILLGSGNRTKLQRLLDEQEAGDIHFAGSVNDQLKARYYASCDVFCAPSTGRESFGIILLEALATGKPVVASNIPGYAGVIEHGVTGLLAKPKDSNDLALALVRMLADSELRHKVVENGLQHVQQFSWENVARRVLAVYERALAIGPRERRPAGRIAEALVSVDG